ncbi:hypothetical protein CNECB9_1100004 [Cupriavidus necator]|uniref:Uncharacterized protein n=1 Tax=Cupriavidus necator TaxID=106590 RepID=A0A1K0I821_CUPNE|nr:hypothetical protein CNECB9_1100004 [Cupriavidus necator]
MSVAIPCRSVPKHRLSARSCVQGVCYELGYFILKTGWVLWAIHYHPSSVIRGTYAHPGHWGLRASWEGNYGFIVGRSRRGRGQS